MRTSVKWFVSVLMVLVMVFSMVLTVSATENEPLLSLNGPETVLHDSEFTLTLESSAAVADGKITIAYDANGLYFQGAEAGAAWPQNADLSLQVNDNGNGKLVLAFAGAVEAEAGSLVELTFQTTDVLGEVTFTLDGENSYITGHAGELAASAAVEVICDAEGFKDVNSEAWYHDGIDYVVEQGYMEGMPGGVFAPEGKTTRAMLMQVLYRMAGAPAVEGDLPFADVASNAWFHEAILWAYQNEIAKGITETAFEPDTNVTREQIAVFFRRFAQYCGLNVACNGDLADFRDAAAVGAYAVEAMEWAVEHGIIQGMPGNLLAPTDAATRAQIATMLVRFDAVLEN